MDATITQVYKELMEDMEANNRDIRKELQDVKNFIKTNGDALKDEMKDAIRLNVDVSNRELRIEIEEVKSNLKMNTKELQKGMHDIIVHSMQTNNSALTEEIRDVRNTLKLSNEELKREVQEVVKINLEINNQEMKDKIHALVKLHSELNNRELKAEVQRVIDHLKINIQDTKEEIEEVYLKLHRDLNNKEVKEEIKQAMKNLETVCVRLSEEIQEVKNKVKINIDELKEAMVDIFKRNIESSNLELQKEIGQIKDNFRLNISELQKIIKNNLETRNQELKEEIQNVNNELIKSNENVNEILQEVFKINQQLDNQQLMEELQIIIQDILSLNKQELIEEMQEVNSNLDANNLDLKKEVKEVIKYNIQLNNKELGEQIQKIKADLQVDSQEFKENVQTLVINNEQLKEEITNKLESTETMFICFRQVIGELIQNWQYDFTTLFNNESPEEFRPYSLSITARHALPPVYGLPRPIQYQQSEHIYSSTPVPQTYSQQGNTYIAFANYSEGYYINRPLHSSELEVPVNHLYTYNIPYKNAVPNEQQNTFALPPMNNNNHLWKRYRRDLSNRNAYLARQRRITIRGNNLNSTSDQHHRIKRQTQTGQQLCQFSTQYITPRAALNNKGNWMYIVNMPEIDNKYTQLVKSETCLSQECNAICGLPSGYSSKCEQRYIQKRLVALEGDGNQLYTDIFWFPSCCVCTISNN
ncbi:hypothetical protein FQA39_LY12328 [Lamprigera yunnana]|nr:hypothetical protein FQA39_LY12328 [Lamprigera yunnana]